MKDRSKDCLIFNSVIQYNADGKQTAYLLKFFKDAGTVHSSHLQIEIKNHTVPHNSTATHRHHPAL